MPTPKLPVSLAVGDDGEVQIVIAQAEVSDEQRAERKAISAKCGHIKRRLSRGEALKGDLLQFVLDMGIDDSIAAKLQSGDKLSDYELHLMLDVYLLHRRLAGV